jgi:hypothetical protein
MLLLGGAFLICKQTFVTPFNSTGKPMMGWVLVKQKALQTDSDLKKWLELAREFSKPLPAK